MKIPKRVERRFAREVSRFQKALADAQNRDVSESDTVTIVRDILGDAFGFDKYSEVTGELAIAARSSTWQLRSTTRFNI